MNKSVIITGASRGIGAETARVFAENNYNMLINYNTSEKNSINLRNELIKKFPDINVEIFKCDVKNYTECEKMVKYALSIFGNIDCLVANAGVSQIKLLIDTNEEDYCKIMDTNVKGTYNSIKSVLPHMLSNKKGKIITISSVLGLIGDSCESIYCASKFAIVGLTKSLAKELGPSGININCVAPGYIDTNMNREISQKEVKELIKGTPLQRIGTPRDVANAIYFLASDKSDFITGSVLNVDGSIIL